MEGKKFGEQDTRYDLCAADPALQAVEVPQDPLQRSQPSAGVPGTQQPLLGQPAGREVAREPVAEHAGVALRLVDLYADKPLSATTLWCPWHSEATVWSASRPG